jgi:hypothetical protein
VVVVVVVVVVEDVDVDDVVDVVDVVEVVEVVDDVDVVGFVDVVLDPVEVDELVDEDVISARPTPDATDAAMKPQTATSAKATPLAIRRLPLSIPLPCPNAAPAFASFCRSLPPETRFE